MTSGSGLENAATDTKKARTLLSASLQNVDLRGTHYNTNVQVRTLEALVWRLPITATPATPSPKRRKPQRARQLSDLQVDELTAAYQAGGTVYDLAERFKINRKTVSGILHRAGVQIRGRLTTEQVDEAARLYAAGWSLARVAAKLDTTANTVRIRLLERGVTMRDAQGRER
ncbi:helix-turn-helix domain containing protein [Amycolatopsis sp. NPDC101161]|uniref:helix-turn-helix domain containing protein n=1 Tax=Amycolatopsis sp. NPDC101161 TaxID=3363940 RepID=UPI00382B7185